MISRTINNRKNKISHLYTQITLNMKISIPMNMSDNLVMKSSKIESLKLSKNTDGVFKVPEPIRPITQYQNLCNAYKQK
jgi:hypothetical protein